MSIPRHGHIAVVIRADGEVPFDDECDDNVRNAIITHLVEQGHQLEVVHVEGKRHKHLRIRNWKK